MITIFNRAEVLTTFEMKRQAEAREILRQNHIDYRVKVVNFNSPSPVSGGRTTHTGTFGEKPRVEYIIYVHKKNVEKANYVIHSK